MAHIEGSGRLDAVLIAGATASGKSALALRLAQRVGGRIINADSMQVYRDLRIVTARPGAAEVALVPHRLYGTVDGAAAYSVKTWAAAAEAELEQARADATLPIVVGGTGLYFKALTQGLSDIPDVPSHSRSEIRSWAAGQPVAALYRELVRRDPETAARLRPTDPQRILRAIEVHEATGESFASFQARRTKPALDVGNCLAVLLVEERDVLRARVDARLDGMIDAGAIDEVQRLAARRLDAALPVMRAIGVPPFLRHVAGEIARADAVSEAKVATRQYIKRQETFFRHQLIGFRPAKIAEADSLLASIAYS